MSSVITSFLSSFISTAHADSEEPESRPPAETTSEEPKEQEAKEEEEEEDEPEDTHPALREDCKQSGKCAALTKHFEHCQEKVQGGEGFKGEDCVEEFMMHCVDNCAAPKLFATLK
ncbi:ubiquinol-cytochrome C reductase hinge domain-containing protein [Crepidotus variabilis]|uniref:Ubiquinol-cytochrome C reductase hinge domain-containing protein n=1 Tax=Crepidotus variabilis TaxID=179855 RepID=A0A9P6JRW5_9AGAR|nr:ubiquinol-cytochrome C reductase hinge domain-containing protein [Crepidotus variabilis]